MKILDLHPWNVTPAEAIQIQHKLRSQLVLEDRLEMIRYVAGADIAIEKSTNTGFAAVVVLQYPSLNEIEVQYASQSLAFPYIPGLLSFREIPVLLKAFAKLSQGPNLLLVDGQGIAHPRRFGLASHLGLLLNTPSIGCAKSRLVGNHPEPDLARGHWCDLIDQNECVGAVLRTRDRVKPIFVSVGHAVGLTRAIEVTLACTDGFRIPKPTRRADHLVGEMKRSTVE